MAFISQQTLDGSGHNDVKTVKFTFYDEYDASA